MATAAEVALLRRLIGDPVPVLPAVPRFTDLELTTALDDAPSCPVPRDPDGYALPGPVAASDTYGVAALLWEDRALLDETEGVAVNDPARVSAERNGDVSVSYAGAGKSTAAGVLTVERMRTMAARLRKRSCNYAAARTIVVDGQGYERRLVRGDLYEGQVVN